MQVNGKSGMDKWQYLFGLYSGVLVCFYWFYSGPMEECHVARPEAATWHLPKVELAIYTVDKNIVVEVGVKPTTSGTPSKLFTNFSIERFLPRYIFVYIWSYAIWRLVIRGGLARRPTLPHVNVTFKPQQLYNMTVSEPTKPARLPNVNACAVT